MNLLLFFSRTLYNSMFTLNERIVMLFCWNKCFEVFESGDFLLFGAITNCCALYRNEEKMSKSWMMCVSSTETTHEQIAKKTKNNNKTYALYQKPFIKWHSLLVFFCQLCSFFMLLSFISYLSQQKCTDIKVKSCSSYMAR